MTPRQQRIYDLKAELYKLQDEEAEEALKQTNGSLAEACMALVRAGQYIAAIKHHREVTGSTLLEAKQIVDKLVEQQRKSENQS